MSEENRYSDSTVDSAGIIGDFRQRRARQRRFSAPTLVVSSLTAAAPVSLLGDRHPGSSPSGTKRKGAGNLLFFPGSRSKIFAGFESPYRGETEGTAS